VPLLWGSRPLSLNVQVSDALRQECREFLGKLSVDLHAPALLQEGRKLINGAIKTAFTTHVGLQDLVDQRVRGQPAPAWFTESMVPPHPLGPEDERLLTNLLGKPDMFSSAGLTAGKSPILIAWHPNYKRMWALQVRAFGSVELAFKHAMLTADIGVRTMALFDATAGLPAFQLHIGSGTAKQLLRLHYQRYGREQETEAGEQTHVCLMMLLFSCCCHGAVVMVVCPFQWAVVDRVCLSVCV
jgi:hypothetical protein